MPPMKENTGLCSKLAATTVKMTAMAAEKAMVRVPEDTRYTRMISGKSR